ncbi:hypothetical protein N7519_010720 [Penicillium mononematosum]|uniref:uncharacterized protein n=1 Tax=Penicillium mononematosum TaxID=268346 RepID=UPI0025473674|nr:uncharacterized protein N7519_010720 [Penicillium mononematosum]KAJ6180259.1 hypothetical protein N7519_010720 [Penicillium mononematosum]
MHLLDLPVDVIHLIFRAIPDQWGLYSLSLQDPHFSPDPWEDVFSLDLWSLNSFVQTCRALYQLLNPSLYQWDAEFYSNRALRWAESANIATARLALSEALRGKIPQKMGVLILCGYIAKSISHRAPVTDTWSWNDPSVDLLEEVIHVGSEPILSLLLDHGAVTNRRVFETMLRQVAGKGHLVNAGHPGMVRFLLEKGIRRDIHLPRWPFMRCAAVHRDPEIARMLLLHGANPSPEEPPGTNFVPLGLAVTLENYAVAQLLRESIDLEGLLG